MRAVIQCPKCGFKVTESQAAAGLKKTWHCPACQLHYQVPDGACCIFCELGRTGCGLGKASKVEKE